MLYQKGNQLPIKNESISWLIAHNNIHQIHIFYFSLLFSQDAVYDVSDDYDDVANGCQGDLYEVPRGSIPYLYNYVLDGQNDAIMPLQQQQTYETPVDSTPCLNSNQAQQEVDVRLPLAGKNESTISRKFWLLVLGTAVITFVVCMLSMVAVMYTIILPKIEQTGTSFQFNPLKRKS